MELDEFRTKDIGEAAALLTAGLKIVRLDTEEDFFWFVFEDKDTKRISDQYWSGELTVSAKTYNDCLRTLKDRIFSQKGELT